MQNSEYYLTFFPGQGICLVPSAEGLLRVPKKEDALPILEELSSVILGDSIQKNLSLKAQELYKTYIDTFGTTNFKESLPTPEEAIKCAIPGFSAAGGTRVSLNPKPIDWDVLEGNLATLGYSLSKREYLNGALNETCPVYVLSHTEHGVISEGKGVDEAQARRSALAEGVERILSADHTRAAERSLVARAKDIEGYTPFIFGAGPRDSYSDSIMTEWIPAYNVSTQKPSWMPTELAYYQYEPQKSHLRLFSLTHTMGLAAGSSIEDATLSGIFEALERDAYWIIMRNRINCPDINLNTVPNLSPNIQKIISALAEKGYRLSIKEASLDWGIAIAHVVLTDTEGRIPAFAHGMGAGFDWATAIARAVTEVVQVHAGLYAFTQDHGYWQDVVGGAGVLGRPEFAWTDPLFYPHIKHLLTPSKTQSLLKVEFKTFSSLIESLKERGHEVLIAQLGKMEGVEVIRVLISGTTHPDERLERITERMKKFAGAESNEWKGFYSDPILT